MGFDEKCQQENFFFPSPVVPGVFCQLYCGCIWQDREHPEADTPMYAVYTHCPHCESTQAVVYVDLWCTLYSEHVPLHIGPLTKKTEHDLRNKLSIMCPVSPSF